MKKLNKAETESLRSQFRWGKSSLILNAINEIGVGESLQFGQEEWLAKTLPGTAILQSFRYSRSSKKFRTHKLDNGGYLCVRIA